MSDDDRIISALTERISVLESENTALRESGDPIELHYFNGPGRGELTRLCFAAGGKTFTDVRIEMADFGPIKVPATRLPSCRIHAYVTLRQIRRVSLRNASDLCLFSSSQTAHLSRRAKPLRLMRHRYTLPERASILAPCGSDISISFMCSMHWAVAPHNHELLT
jgi:hypothetical protein